MQKNNGMPLYKHKPLVVGAYQFTDQNKEEMLYWVNSHDAVGRLFKDRKNGQPVLMVYHTKYTYTWASVGDYLILNENGTIHVMSKEEFEFKYEPVEETN